MKKILTLFLCLIFVHLSTEASNDIRIEFHQLPAQSQEWIKEHFRNQSIALVKMEKEFFTKSYEVIFTNGNKIEFDRNGTWEEIDCKYTELPLAIVPEQIKNYVSKNYPEIKISKIEKESKNRYEVGLTNGLDLKFDSKFNLIDIDN